MKVNLDKVAVINRTNFKNYGSVLQCYALCEVISKMGYSSEILWETGGFLKNFDLRPRKLIKILFTMIRHPNLMKSVFDGAKTIQSKKISNETVSLFDSFVKKNVRQRLVNHRTLVKLANSTEYIKFVCGSDQIWCSTTSYVDPLMYLQFAPREKRIAYAPSIGREYVPDYNKKVMKKYINSIPCVSIREDAGQKIIKNLTGRNVPVVADPTLLLSCEYWKTLESQIEIKKTYILLYFLDLPSEHLQKKIYELSLYRNLDIISIGQSLPYIENKDGYSQVDCGPSEFLAYMSNADSVITDSYHGMLFSIIYEKEFYSVERNYGEFDQSSRQLTILKKVGLEDRYLKNESRMNFQQGIINYSKVNDILSNFRSESIDYLEGSLKK